MAIAFPEINPNIVEIGPVAIKWYGLSYVLGILLGAYMIPKLAAKKAIKLPKDFIDNFLIWAIIGIILGGRLGYVLFYGFEYYAAHPSQILATWNGGMSFHGGLIGLICAMLIFCKKHNFAFFQLADLVAIVAPIGIFFGRIANFINAELYGRTTDAPWGVIFPDAGSTPRHPSQLYEAMVEGVLIFVIMYALWVKTDKYKNSGVMAAKFLVLYSFFRFHLEHYREPDLHIGFVYKFLTMGQILCIPMLVAGLMIYLFRNRQAT